MKVVKSTLIPLAFWLIVWQLAALAVGKALILPGPWTVLYTLAGLVTEGSFWATTLLTLVRIFAGMLAGVLLGTLIAVLTCASVW